MLQDVVGSFLAVLAFAAILYAPGFLTAFAVDLFGFRQLRFARQSLWALALSFAISPLGAYGLGRLAGLRAVSAVFGLCAFLCGFLLLRQRGRQIWRRQDRRLTFLIALGWTAAVLLLTLDLQLGHRLFFSVEMADGSYRIAFTDAVLRTGIPPANPLYFAGSPAPMRYYYFWYVLCAAAAQLAHVSARQAFAASSVWAGFGLVAVVLLFSRHFFCWPRRQRYLALGLLLITGVDLLPALGQALLQPALNGDSEWWSVDPIDSWPDSLLWVPHHVAGVLCSLLAFLLLWRTRHRRLGPGRARLAVAVLAALSFASAVGLSVYVALGFALMMLAWLLWLTLRRDPLSRSFWQGSLLAGALSAVLLLPFLQELLGDHGPALATAATAQVSHTPAFTLSVRRMIDSGLLTGLPLFVPLNQRHPVLLDQGLRLLLLLPGLAMELGLYGAVLVLLLFDRRGRRSASPAHRTALFFTVSGLALTMFLSSAVITNNDFGYRAVMLPQFFLLLLTAELLGAWWLPTPTSRIPVPSTPGRRRLLQALFLLGAAGTVYWAVLLRAWLPWEVAHPKDGFARLPEDEFQIRHAFAALDRIAPRDAVIAFRAIDPTPDRGAEVMAPNEFYQRMLVMDTGRQMLNAEEKCAVHFGGDPGPCHEVEAATARLYALPLPSPDWARAFCRRFGVSYLSLSAWDPTFAAQDGWPAALPEVVHEPRLRILSCR